VPAVTRNQATAYPRLLQVATNPLLPRTVEHHQHLLPSSTPSNGLDNNGSGGGLPGGPSSLGGDSTKSPTSPTATPSPTGKDDGASLLGGVGDVATTVLGGGGSPNSPSPSSPTVTPSPSSNSNNGGGLGRVVGSVHGGDSSKVNTASTPSAQSTNSPDGGITKGSGVGVHNQPGGSTGGGVTSAATQQPSPPTIAASSSSATDGLPPQNITPTSPQPESVQGALSTPFASPASSAPDSSKASQTPVVQAASNTLLLPSGATTALVFTTEVFPTVIPVTVTSGGKISTGFRTVTSSQIVQTTPTPGSNRNGVHSSSNKSTGVIAGSVVGGVVAVTLLVALVFLLLRCIRHARQEKEVKAALAIPNPDFFRPSPGTGWDVDSSSTRSSSSSSLSGPFVKPMSQAWPHLNMHKKAAPGAILIPTVSEDPFWDPSQQFDRVPIKAAQMRVKTATRDPFVDPPLSLPPSNNYYWSGGAHGGPSRLSAISTPPPKIPYAIPYGVAL